MRSRKSGEIVPLGAEQSNIHGDMEASFGPQQAIDRNLKSASMTSYSTTNWIKVKLDGVHVVKQILWFDEHGNSEETWTCARSGCTCLGKYCSHYTVTVSIERATSQILPDFYNVRFGDTVKIAGSPWGTLLAYEIAVIGEKVDPCYGVKRKLQEAEQNYGISKGNLQKVQNYLKGVEEKLAEANKKNTGLAADLEEKNGKLEEVNEKNTELAADLEEKNGKLEEANEKNTELAADLEKEKGRLSDATNEIAGLKADLGKAKKEACHGICTLPDYTLKVMCDDYTTIYVDGVAIKNVAGSRKSFQLATTKIPAATKVVMIKCYNPKLTTANGIKAQILDADGNLLSETDKNWECSNAASSGYEAATITDQHSEWTSELSSGAVIWTNSPGDDTAYCKKNLS